MIRQGSDRYASLALIPSCLYGFPEQRLEFGLDRFLALQETVFRLFVRSWSTNCHAARIGRDRYSDKEPFEK